MGEAQSRSVMLHHQDLNSAYGGSSSSLSNRVCDKDSNFNFLPGKDDEGFTGNGGGGGGDENRNRVRPRNLTLGHDLQSSSTSPSGFHNPGLISPLSRRPCWSPLEPLPEIESGDDGYGRVPPDGAEERRMEEEVGKLMMRDENRELQKKMEADEELEDEWSDSDSESQYSERSGGSMSSLNIEGGADAMLMGGWDRIGVGEPKSNPQEGEPTGPTRATRRRSSAHKHLPGGTLADLREEGDLQSSDSDGELPELTDAVWTLQDRERFKAQEMEKHQVQLTMYRRLALIRWVRTLQARVQEQQNRLQSSFDVILTHRKELLRVGAASVASHAPAAAVGQS
ncbi:UPF0500 protein C1orf216 homolog [Cololabis saira]|uniref:UPF0500 protein C1orf216 homolog n=1 Tax=Cololabis saira TaxID=129043 RepID=UPI002AD2D672|nr:UPF0500 protein C1orf216 homolog [Cololabis saira]